MSSVWNIDKVTYIQTGLGPCCTWTPAGYISSKRCILNIPTSLHCADPNNDSSFTQQVDVCNLVGEAWSQFDYNTSDVFGISC